MSQIPVDLKFLLRLYGVASSYRDAWGATKFVAPKVLMQVLSRLGVPCNTIEERKHSLAVAKKQIASRALPPVILWEEGRATQHTILSLPARLGAPDAKSLTLRCQLIAVDGCSGEAIEPEPIQTWEFVSDKRTLVRARLLGRERLFRHRLSFGGALAAGYYRLEVLRAHDASLIGSARVIVSPRRCFLPQQLENERPIWGLAAQLYSLWRDEGQLIGDFPSLRRLLQTAEAHGASFVGLNPLHAIPLTNNATWSPYAPLSRELLNILYIGVEEVPEWALLSDVDREQFKRVRVSTALIDYQQAATQIIRIIRALFDAFAREELAQATERAERYREFVRRKSELLSVYSRSADCLELDQAAFAYAQWLAHEQLEAVAQLANDAAREQGTLGLYLDLALGGTASSLEVQQQMDAYATELSMGAPPDELNLKGQSWGLVPYIPWQLRELSYTPFVRVLREVMQYAGAVRIDHAMVLSRVYCVPIDQAATESGGAYVYSRVRELMAVVAIESQRARCVVIGEDLGTVPERFRAMMREYRMLSYKVLWFMQDSEGFVVPAKYERLSLVVPTTHDLPTIAGFLSGDDNELRQALELFPRPEMFEEYCKRREQDVKALMTLLAQHQLCPTDIGDIEQMVSAILALLAGSGSLLYAVSLEDVLGLREQLNVPGTTVEYPNWRERLPLSVEQFLSHPRFQFVAALGQLAKRSV